MKKILLTGVDGFLGKKLFNKLKDNYEISGISRRNSSKSIFLVDLSNKEKINEIITKVSPNIIIHTAAIANVEKCEDNKDLAFKSNVQITENIAQACARNKIKIIYISTDYVFSGREESYSINSKTSPINYYGETKLKGEKIIQSLVEDYVIIRPSILYGFNSISDVKNFVLSVVNNVVAGNEVVLDNQRIKRPILIDDIAKVIEKLTETNFKGIVHISGPDALTKYDWGIKIADIFNLPKENIVGRNLNETNRPFNIIFSDSTGKTLNLDKGLKLIKEQMKWKS